MVRVLKLWHLVENYFKIDSRSFRIVGLIFETLPVPEEEELSFINWIKVSLVSNGNNKNNRLL